MSTILVNKKKTYKKRRKRREFIGNEKKNRENEILSGINNVSGKCF